VIVISSLHRLAGRLTERTTPGRAERQPRLRDGPPHALGERARVLPRQPLRRHRVEDLDGDAAGASHQPALPHDQAAAVHRDGHDRNARLDREHERATLESRQPAVGAARALGEHHQRDPLVHERTHAAEDLETGMLPIDQHVAGAGEVPAEEREPAERRLGHDAELIRQRPEQDRDVVDALVVRGEEVARARIQPLQSRGVHRHTRRDQDETRPRTRAAVREVAAAIDERRQDRHRAEHERVDRDRRDQEEDGTPPVIGRHGAERSYELRVTNYEWRVDE
jgi:hypothetical protein